MLSLASIANAQYGSLTGKKPRYPYQEAILSQTPALKASVLNQAQEALRQKELEQTASLFNQQLAQQAEQYNTSMAWQKEQAERDLALRTEQFLKSYEQSKSQFETSLAEQKAEREAELAQSMEQWNKSFELNKSIFETNLQEQIRQHNESLAQAAEQFNKSLEQSRQQSEATLTMQDLARQQAEEQAARAANIQMAGLGLAGTYLAKNIFGGKLSGGVGDGPVGTILEGSLPETVAAEAGAEAPISAALSDAMSGVFSKLAPVSYESLPIPSDLALSGYGDLTTNFKNLQDIAAQRLDELWSSMPEFSVDTSLAPISEYIPFDIGSLSDLFSGLEIPPIPYADYLGPVETGLTFLEKVPIPGVSDIARFGGDVLGTITEPAEVILDPFKDFSQEAIEAAIRMGKELGGGVVDVGGAITGTAWDITKSIVGGAAKAAEDVVKGVISGVGSVFGSIFGGTWLCTEVYKTVGLNSKDRMLLKIIRNYAQKEHPGWLKFYLDEGPKLVEEIAKKENPEEFYRQLKQDMVVPVLEYIKEAELEKAYQHLHTTTLGLFGKYAPTIEIKEHQEEG